MAKLQCARLMKFIMPSVTDSPTDSTNSSIPKAKPSNSTPSNGVSIPGRARGAPVCRPRLLLHPRLHRILHVRVPVDFHVDQAVAHFFHAPNINGEYDVAGFRIDRHR